MAFSFQALNKKGQISIEFILLLVIMLVYIQTIIQPILEISFNATDDITRLGQARSAAQKLVNAIDYVSLSSGNSEQEVRFFLPANSVLTVNCAQTTSTNKGANDSVTFSVNLNSPAIGTACDSDTDNDESKCTKSFNSIAKGIQCANFSATGNAVNTGPEDGRLVRVRVAKSGTTLQVQEAV